MFNDSGVIWVFTYLQSCAFKKNQSKMVHIRRKVWIQETRGRKIFYFRGPRSNLTLAHLGQKMSNYHSKDSRRLHLNKRWQCDIFCLKTGQYIFNAGGANKNWIQRTVYSCVFLNARFNTKTLQFKHWTTIYKQRTRQNG